ncbi:endonuclease/exonuclease/phosphatase (EEP) superfamily protein YafD [Rhodococcus sp. SMB37]|uniref:endonuclease/exonuclease/phosphatase family protein n=1 Tax=Rhodococcus sp. SMB37 TaxID=2512213 RepID=UPI001043C2E6|nr:endonuclease/exonuclease/phosphatase family protein [Rhodococcus sp. SMB37]TCN56879.1 endonuclease/exonuclease/phosphatase (EEP) superfamily protein YafD [Rhodococcus sp. SMB37]
MATVFRWAAAVLAGLATLVGVVGVVLHYSTSSARLPVLAASAASYMMIGSVLGAVVFALLRYRVATAVALLIVVAAVWIQAPRYVGESAGGGGDVLTVMQANVLFGEADPATVVSEVEERRVDLLTVSELTPEAVDAFAREGLDRVLPYHFMVPEPGAAGTGIWSRFPLSDEVEYDGFVMNQVSATAEVPGTGPVAVYAFHPVPPVYDTQVWADELSRLHGILESAPASGPVVAGADFNATYDHAQYRAMLTGRLRDTAEQVGAGLLFTYPTDKRIPPLVGIDQILVAGGRATSVETVTLPGSDHRAVVAQIQLDRSPR